MSLRSLLFANKIEHVFHPATNAPESSKTSVANAFAALNSVQQIEVQKILTNTISALPADIQVGYLKNIEKVALQPLPAISIAESQSSSSSEVSVDLGNFDDIFGSAEDTVVVNTATPAVESQSSSSSEVSVDLGNFDDIFGAEDTVVVNTATPDSNDYSNDTSEYLASSIAHANPTDEI